MRMLWDIGTSIGVRYPESQVVDVDDERVIFISKHGMTHNMTWDKINYITAYIPEREWTVTATLSGDFVMKVKARNANEAASKAPMVGVGMFNEDGEYLDYPTSIEYEDMTQVRVVVEGSE